MEEEGESSAVVVHIKRERGRGLREEMYTRRREACVKRHVLMSEDTKRQTCEGETKKEEERGGRFTRESWARAHTQWPPQRGHKEEYEEHSSGPPP